MNKLIAFHGETKIKADLLAQLQLHHDADEIIKGVYWEDGKGCAVGCTIHSNDHEVYETRFGIPIQLAYLEDRIFERLPNAEAKQWPLKFIQTIPVGADLTDVPRLFLIEILSNEEHGYLKHTKLGSSPHAAIAKVIELLKSKCTDKNEWDYAVDTADAAANVVFAAKVSAHAHASAAITAAAYGHAAAHAHAAITAAEAADAAVWMGNVLLNLLAVASIAVDETSSSA